jgi:chromosomal replication initiation ATPase DnaA
VKPETLTAAAQVFAHVYAEVGAIEPALYAAMRMVAVNRAGQVERTQTSVVLATVCEHFEVELADLLGRRRTGLLSRARQTAMALLHGAGLSYADAGATVGRTKGDAIYACQKAESDPRLAADVSSVAALVARRVGRPARKLPVIWPAKEGAG